MALAATVVFAAVLLYSRAASPIPRIVLRAMHAWSGERAAHAAAAGDSSTVQGTHSGLERAPGERPQAALDVNPFAPAQAGGARTASAGEEPGTVSGPIDPSGAAASSPTSGQSGPASQGVAGGVPGLAAASGGVAPQRAGNQLAKVATGLSAGTGGGVKVEQVLPSSVAGKLGLQPGDVILAVNGSPIATPDEFAKVFEADGLPRQIDAVRDGRTIHLHP